MRTDREKNVDITINKLTRFNSLYEDSERKCEQLIKDLRDLSTQITASQKPFESKGEGNLV
jgi:hypothetical protein